MILDAEWPARQLLVDRSPAIWSDRASGAQFALYDDWAPVVRFSTTNYGCHVLPPGTVFDLGDHSLQILASPEDLGDRYRARVEAEPGAPGVTGDFPHLHPCLIETFTCISGDMVVRVGRTTRAAAVGETIEVPRGQVHGFVNSGSHPLILETEVIFPDGYDETSDLMHFAQIYDRLKRERSVNSRTGEPPLLQMAVLTHSWRRVIRQPGVAGALMPLMAAVGRITGYRSEPFG